MVLIILVGGLFLWWLLIVTEGVYLGRGVVIWLYDVYAKRYDGIKDLEPDFEAVFLARPLLDELNGYRAPLVLDVATGTGRLPKSLFEDVDFHGKVTGIDLSRRMLRMAAQKLKYEIDHQQLHLIHTPAETIPFLDGYFDVVTCLEALEFMVSPRKVLEEIVRVVRPGGIILLTNRQGRDATLMLSKTQSHERFQAMLENEFRLAEVRIDRWQEDYVLVWAIKPPVDEDKPRGAQMLSDYWRCKRCGRTTMIQDKGRWTCEDCGLIVLIGKDGVIELHRVKI
jgi:ubiquinone/menaquinone biosynthesis C-methylase UbiE/ribosomal protein S27AE